MTNAYGSQKQLGETGARSVQLVKPIKQSGTYFIPNNPAGKNELGFFSGTEITCVCRELDIATKLREIPERCF